MPTTSANTKNNTSSSQNTQPQFNVGSVLGSIFGGGGGSNRGGSGSSSSSSSGSSSGGGGGGGVWGAVASVVNNTVSNLFNRKKVNKELDLKAQEQQFKQSLSTLDNQQKYVLQQALNNAKTQTERLQILNNAVTQIKVAQINNAGSNQMKTAYLVLGSAVVLVGLLLVIKKTD